MDDEKALDIYLKRLEEIAKERLKDLNIRPLEAIKQALNVVEGEMQGY